MAKKIIWSPLAIAKHQKIIDYLQDKWSYKAIIQFIELTNKVLVLIVQVLLNSDIQKKEMFTRV